jgi:hypothetical protein
MDGRRGRDNALGIRLVGSCVGCVARQTGQAADRRGTVVKKNRRLLLHVGSFGVAASVFAYSQEAVSTDTNLDLPTEYPVGQHTGGAAISYGESMYIGVRIPDDQQLTITDIIVSEGDFTVSINSGEDGDESDCSDVTEDPPVSEGSRSVTLIGSVESLTDLGATQDPPWRRRGSCRQGWCGDTW